MKKALASVVIVAFAGLFCVSLLVVFGSNGIGDQIANQQSTNSVYFIR